MQASAPGNWSANLILLGGLMSGLLWAIAPKGKNNKSADVRRMDIRPAFRSCSNVAIKCAGKQFVVSHSCMANDPPFTMRLRRMGHTIELVRRLLVVAFGQVCRC